MGIFSQKAIPLILTAVQVAGDVRKVVESRVKGLVSEAMEKYGAELGELKQRLDVIEETIKSGAQAPAKVPGTKPAATARSRRAKPRKKTGPRNVKAKKTEAESAPAANAPATEPAVGGGN